MMRLLVLLLLALAGPVLAQPVRVTSGEHDGFTRLVFDYGRPVDWRVGRTNDGYQMHISGNAPTYELSAVFELIGKARLASLWAEPQAGDLYIGLACACHVIPFEFRSGIVVLDIKDGPPPKGSSFELSFQGDEASLPLPARKAPRPRKRPAAVENQAIKRSGHYDWTVLVYDNLHDATPKQTPPVAKLPTVLPPEPGLEPLRTQILHQIARGASQGIVDMAVPEAAATPIQTIDFPSAQVRIGEPQTSVNQSDQSINEDIGAQGAPCLGTDLLDIRNWADTSTSLVNQMASTRNGLSGEFDRPDFEAVARAIKFYLHLGYGAEARQMIAAFTEPDTNVDVWKSLSYLIDGEPDPEHTFDGQAACSGPAALWALLGDSSLQPGDSIEEGAVRLAFADLPMHLRRHLGPTLSERLSELGSAEAARALRDTILRASGGADDATSLMEAEANLQSGNPQKAERLAEMIAGEGGPDQPRALIMLTKARVAQNLPISPEIALALQAYVTDHQGSALAPELQEALLLAEAASGNFAAAFQGLQTHPARQSDIWRMVATLAENDDFLAFAVLDPQATIPKVPAETAETIARRLTALGLGSAAERWLSVVDAPDQIIVAQAAIMRRDARTALESLVTAHESEAQALTLQALSLLGEDGRLADLLAASGDLAAASAALARAGDWARLANAGEEPWKTIAAKQADTPEGSPTDQTLPYGPLARGEELVKAGQDTRTAIEALLAAVSTP